MRVERHGVHPPQPLRMALLLAGAALMIIVGLLGMHTFSSEVAGHGTTVGAHAATTVNHATPVDDHAEASAGSVLSVDSVLSEVPDRCDDVCMTRSTDGHSDMLSACILALLAGLLLLLRPPFVHRLSPLQRVWVSRLRPAARNMVNGAPSLTFLSISRT